MLRLGLGATALVLASAQIAETAAAQTRCRYSECALRVDSKRIVRGHPGDVVVHLGPYTDVTRRVGWLSDSARVHAARYGPRRSTAASLRLVAWGLTITSGLLGYQVYHDYERQADLVSAQQASGGPVTARLELDKSKLFASSALSAGAFVAGWMAGRLNEAARTELARAVWWHNRELRQD